MLTGLMINSFIVTKKVPDSVCLIMAFHYVVPQASKAETDSDSDAHHYYTEPDVTGMKEVHLLHPSIYSMWKCEVEVSYPFKVHALDAWHIPVWYLHIYEVKCHFQDSLGVSNAYRD
jgi:hypothetical protein